MIRKSSRVHSDLWVTRFEGRKEGRASRRAASPPHRNWEGKGVLNLSRPRLENATNVSPKYSDTKEESSVVVFRANSLSNKWLPFLQRTSLFRPLSYFARWKSIKSPSAMSAHRSHSLTIKRKNFNGIQWNVEKRISPFLFYYSIGSNSWLVNFLLETILFDSISFANPEYAHIRVTTSVFSKMNRELIWNIFSFHPNKLVHV